MTSSAHFGDREPEPPIPAWAPGADGVGPPLHDADDAPVRWLLLDGYVYHVVYNKSTRRWAVNEWRGGSKSVSDEVEGLLDGP